MKKIIWIIAIAAAGYFILFVVPDLISDKKAESRREAAELEDKASEKAEEMVDRGLDSNQEGSGGPYRQFTGKARDAGDRAVNRSNDTLEQMEE